MIRPLTCVCMLLAGASGLYLYQTKHRTSMLDRQIQQTLKEADAARARIGILQAEWALLNEPERLAELADRFLTLKAVAPSQFVTLSDLDQHLPAPVPEAPAVASNDTAEPAARMIVPVVAAGPPALPAEARRAPSPLVSAPAQARPKPSVQLAAARSAASRREYDVAERRAAFVRREPRPVRDRDVLPPAAHEPFVVAVARRAASVPASAGIASPRASVAAVVAMASTRPAARRVAAYAPASASVAYAPMVRAVAVTPVMAMGSMLGAAHVSLPPPVPVGNVTTGWASAR